MKLKRLGKNISAAEILNVSAFGIWMLVKGKEYFLSYEDFPWFKHASVEEIYDFEFLHGQHLHWPKLDIDLSVDVIGSPHDFPLKSKIVR